MWRDHHWKTWPFFVHTPDYLVGIHFKGMDAKMYRRVKSKINEYMSYWMLNVDKMKEIIDLFNETACVGLDESIPLAKAIMKYIRHKLVDSTIQGYFRLVHMLDAMMRHCGIRAQVLIGRYRFLNTLMHLALSFNKNASKTYQDASNFTFKCLEDWCLAFKDRPDLFPHYAQLFQRLIPIFYRLDPSIQRLRLSFSSTTPILLDPVYWKKYSIRDHAMNEIEIDEESLGSSVVYQPPVKQSHASYHSEETSKTAQSTPKYSPQHSNHNSLIIRVDSEPHTSHDIVSQEEEGRLSQRIPSIFIYEENIDDRQILSYYQPQSPTANSPRNPSSCATSPATSLTRNNRLSSRLSDYLAAVAATTSRESFVEHRTLSNRSNSSRAWKSPSYSHQQFPSMDNIQIKFYGSQRVVVSKKEMLSPA